MTGSGRTFRGLSPAQRVAERRTRLLEAALELIGTEGWSAATMTAVCGRAGLTERYFYESFSDRDALYLALIDGLAEEVEQALLDALATAPEDPPARLRTIAARLVEILVGDPRKGRVALLEGLGSEALQRRRREILLSFGHLLRDQARALLGAAAPPEPELELGAMAMIGAVGELLQRRLDGTLEIADAALADYLAGLGLRIVAA